MAVVKGRWPDDLVLLDLNRRDNFTLRDAFANALILGSIGSGKTSGPFRTLLRALIRAGCGGLMLPVKQGAAGDYRRIVEEEGRLDELIEFSLDGKHRFNFLGYISERHGDFPITEVVHLLTALIEVLDRAGMKDDKFFSKAGKELQRSALTPQWIGKGTIDLQTLGLMLSTLPRSADEILSGDSYAAQIVNEAWTASRGTPQASQMDSVVRFFRYDWPNYAVETRESIRCTAQVAISELMHEPLCTLFGTTTTVTPDDILNGKIVLVSIPPHVHQNVGRIACTVWKILLQRAMYARFATIEKAEDQSSIRPCFFALDEAQELITPESDDRFVSTSRELRACSFFSTHSINSFFNVIGKPATMMALSGLRNRFLCRTEDPESLDWAKAVSGQNFAYGIPVGPESWFTADFPTDLLRLLKQGGKDKVVEAVLVKGNEKFKGNNDRRWAKLTFNQNPPRAAERWKSLREEYFTNNVRIVVPEEHGKGGRA